MTHLTEGMTAPDFELESSTGGAISLHSLRGRNVVMYFYPKDDTPGCTKEACSFRDELPRFDGLSATVLGVSPDQITAHEKFSAKFGLTFPLLADPDHVVSEAYGVWQQKSMYGKKYMGIVRTTFLIGPDGIIKRIWRQVKPEAHALEVAQALKA